MYVHNQGFYSVESEEGIKMPNPKDEMTCPDCFKEDLLILETDTKMLEGLTIEAEVKEWHCKTCGKTIKREVNW